LILNVPFSLQALNAIPDQDTFYDVTDALEEQGMEDVIRKHMNKKGADLDLLDQFHIYEVSNANVFSPSIPQIYIELKCGVDV
jgi:hypothetical protein